MLFASVDLTILPSFSCVATSCKDALWHNAFRLLRRLIEESLTSHTWIRKTTLSPCLSPVNGRVGWNLARLLLATTFASNVSMCSSASDVVSGGLLLSTTLH